MLLGPQWVLTMNWGPSLVFGVKIRVLDFFHLFLSFMQAPKNMNAQRQSQNLLYGCKHCLWNKKQENVARNKTTPSQTKKIINNMLPETEQLPAKQKKKYIIIVNNVPIISSSIFSKEENCMEA